jgi:hypothetical protein
MANIKPPKKTEVREDADAETGKGRPSGQRKLTGQKTDIKLTPSS